MKKKLLITLIITVLTLKLYSQKDLIKTENRRIISSITNEFWTHTDYVYPLFYQEHLFRLPQFFAEYTTAPNDKTTYIKESYFRNEMKFGNTEKTELSKYDVEYFYNSDGILKQVAFNGNEIILNIGKYGELIEKQMAYETNSNGISKTTYYDEAGKLISHCQINYNNLGQIISYDTYSGNSTFKSNTTEFKYDLLGRIIESTLFQNFKNKPVKSVPREKTTHNYKNLILTSSFSKNNFAEGMFELTDFSKRNGLNTGKNKTLIEINDDIRKRWVIHSVFSEQTLIDDKKNNYWSEKRIYRKVLGEVKSNELLYTIIREYK